MRKYLVKKITPDPVTHTAEFDEQAYQEKENCIIEQRAITFEDGYLTLVYEIREVGPDFVSVVV